MFNLDRPEGFKLSIIHLNIIGHGNESHRFASTARMPQKLPPKIFIIYKKFIIFTNKAKLNKISNKIMYRLQ
jgi:hypothetical protein